MKRLTAKKNKWLVHGGPFDGKPLWLTDGTTFIFELSGSWKGRYIKGHWEPA